MSYQSNSKKGYEIFEKSFDNQYNGISMTLFHAKLIIQKETTKPKIANVEEISFFIIQLLVHIYMTLRRY